MNASRIRFKTLLLALITLSFPLGVMAEIEMEASLSDTTMFLGEEITVQVKVNGVQENLDLKFPDVEGLTFRRLGRPSMSSRTVIVNGKVNSFSGLVYSIGLRATQKGRYEIPGFEVVYQGRVYRSNELSIFVKESGEQTNMKLVMTGSKNKLYVNEPLEITLKWYLQDNVEEYSFDFPLLADKDEFKLRLSEGEKGGDVVNLSVDGYKIPFQKKTERLEGDEYTVYQVQFEIFPSTPGKLNISPAGVTAAVRAGTELKKDFFGRVVRAPKLKRVFSASKALEIEVKSVPTENIPSTYTGAVGEFSISIAADNTQVKVGDPIQLTIRITGNGRFEEINQPVLSEVQEFDRNFLIVDNLQPGDIKDNSIEFKQVIRPKHDRVDRIPEVEFAFFNPTTERFQKVFSNAIALKVLPAKEVQKDDIVSFNENEKPRVEVFTRKKSGLYSNYVFEDALISESMTESWVVVLLFPPMLYFAILAFITRRRRLMADVSLVRAKSAKSKGHKRLKKAGKELKESGDKFYEELSTALRGYVGDKFNLGAGQVTAVDIQNLISDGILDENKAGLLMSLLNEIDRCRFAPQLQDEATKNILYNKVADLMKQLEKAIK